MRSGFARWLVLLFGFAILYAPIAVVIAYSFNASRLVTIWSGFSTRWYAALWKDRQLLESAATSLLVASVSAAIATILGTLAAFALARGGRIPLRAPFSFAVHAPLVMPDIVLGLALLLVFVALDLNRGLLTIILAHATLSMCYAAIVVRARLATLDGSLEEAARDLGAGPVSAFVRVVAPILAPALLSAYLLAFTISLDDVVIASFTAGPNATTLPMRIYSQVRLGVTPEINALSTLVLGAVGAILLIASRFGRLGR